MMPRSHAPNPLRAFMSSAALVSLALAVFQPSIAGALADRVTRPARVGSVRSPGSQRADTYGAETQPLDRVADFSAPWGESFLGRAAAAAGSERAPQPPPTAALPQATLLLPSGRPLLWRPLQPSAPFVPWRPLAYTSARPPPARS